MNEELTLDGVKYISVKRAAEITKYSKDYVGQLCREGKILGSRIGRNWYIAEKSILRHRTENSTEISPVSKIRQNENVRLLDSINQAEEDRNKSFSQSRENIYSEPLATYYSDDRPVLPQLRRGTEALKERLPKDNGHVIPINIIDSHVDVPIKYVDKKPVLSSPSSLTNAFIVVMFMAVSFGFFVINNNYIQTTWSGAHALLGGSVLEAFNQTAELVNTTVDNTIYDYLYASLFDG